MTNGRIPPDSALSRLRDGELCWIVLRDSKPTEAVWSAKRSGFFYNAGGEPAFVNHAEVAEWWPANKKF
jgi:hypothetical protein